LNPSACSFLSVPTQKIARHFLINEKNLAMRNEMRRNVRQFILSFNDLLRKKKVSVILFFSNINPLFCLFYTIYDEKSPAS